MPANPMRVPPDAVLERPAATQRRPGLRRPAADEPAPQNPPQTRSRAGGSVLRIARSDIRPPGSANCQHRSSSSAIRMRAEANASAVPVWRTPPPAVRSAATSRTHDRASCRPPMGHRLPPGSAGGRPVLQDQQQLQRAAPDRERDSIARGGDGPPRLVRLGDRPPADRHDQVARLQAPNAPRHCPARPLRPPPRPRRRTDPAGARNPARRRRRADRLSLHDDCWRRLRPTRRMRSPSRRTSSASAEPSGARPTRLRRYRGALHRSPVERPPRRRPAATRRPRPTIPVRPA